MIEYANASFQTEAERQSTHVGEPEGPRAIEVAALFDGDLVAVHHLGPPRTRGIRSATLLAGAGLLGLAALGAFAFALASPAGAGARAWGGIALAGTLGAAALAALGIGRRLDERAPRDYTVGPDPRALFPAPEGLLPSAAFALVRAAGDGHVLRVAGAMRGEIGLGDRLASLEELVAGAPRDEEGAVAIALPAGARAWIALGQGAFAIASVAPPRRQAGAPLRIDWTAERYTLATAAAALLAVALGAAVPPDPEQLSLDAFASRRLAHVALLARAVPESPAIAKLPGGGGGNSGGDGRPPAGRGRPRGTLPQRLRHKGFAPRTTIAAGPDQARAAVAEALAGRAGVLTILHGARTTALSGVFAPDSAFGDASDAFGSLHDPGADEAACDGPDCGLGLVASRGEGGPGDGTVGFGGFGPLGDRGGGCCGRGPGHGFGPGGGGALARHVARAPEVIPGTATVPQSLDKEIVRRVIRRHLQEVRFCYERELGRRPDLYGRVVARFVIAPSGDVLASNIESSTMAAPAVEGCVADAIRRWQFPPSPSHAAAVVTYPFVLKRAGAE